MTQESEDIDNQIREGNQRLSRSHVCGQEERRAEQNE
jgi:hypothetical protein